MDNALSSEPETVLPTATDVRDAARRIAPYVLRTPVLASEEINAAAGALIWFKCENLQLGGAFKLRGAMNAVWSLSFADARRGVATHSSGNHGAGLARAARARDVPCYVVVPEGSVRSKVGAIEALGASVRYCAPTMAAREAGLAEICEQTGASPVHPFNDARVIAGAGSAALELLDAQPDLEVLIVPVGGGGLLAGTALIAKDRHPAPQVFGAEPSGANDAYLSFKSGVRITDFKPQTIADGLRATIGPMPFEIIRRHVDDILLVDENEIVSAMRLAWERLRVVVETSSAVALAALLRDRDRFQGKRVGIVLSGGNVDMDSLPWLSG